MKMPIIYFILYILGLELVSAIPPTQNASVSATHSEETIDVTVPSSTAPNVTISQGIMSKDDGQDDGRDGYNVTTKGQDVTERGTSNKTGETATDGVTQNSTTGQPSVSAASVPTTLPPTDISTTTTSIQSSSTTGYIVLLILVIAIAFLLVVIYILRKKSRRYSFDLHRKSGEEVNIPLNTVDQEGSFQPTITKEDKPPSIQGVPEEHITNKDTDSTPKGSTSDTRPASSNGTDKGDRDTEKAPSEDSFGSQVPLSPKDEPGSFTLDLKDIDLNHSNQTSVESLGEQQNENNNNIVTGGTPIQESAQAYQNEDFTEIRLDETV